MSHLSRFQRPALASLVALLLLTLTVMTGVDFQATEARAAGSGQITVNAGGDRSGSAVSPLQGVVFEASTSSAFTPVAGTCTTNASGSCTVTGLATSSGGTTYYVREQSAPAGYAPIAETYTGSAQSPYRLSVSLTNAKPSVTAEMYGGQLWESVRDNPAVPARTCAQGSSVALVYDLSYSISKADVLTMKQAGKTFVDALAGTAATVGVYSFASAAPAKGNTNLAPTAVSTGATTIKNKIDGLTQPTTSADYYTNWDSAFRTVSGVADLVVFITDGDPTTYADGSTRTNNATDRTVDEAIASANLVKQKSRVLAVGVGDPKIANLKLISGPTVNDDYVLLSGFSALANQLLQVAAGQCGVTVNITKNVDGVPTDGWPITATSSTGGVQITSTTGGKTASGGKLIYSLNTVPAAGAQLTLAETTPQGNVYFKDGSCTVVGGSTTTWAGGTLSFAKLSQGATVNCVLNNETRTANLHLEKSASPAAGTAVVNGTQITYTLKYWNDGPVDVTNATITDVLPAGVAYVSSSGGTNSGGTVTFSGLSVAKNTSSSSGFGTKTITVTVDSTTAASTSGTCTPTQIANTASINGTYNTNQTVSATSNTVTHTLKVPALAVTKTSDAGGTLVPGQSVTYTISVKNTGGSTASGVTVRDPLPTGTTYVSSSAGTLAANQVTWAAQDIAPGATATYTLKVQVASGATNGTTVTNTAYATAQCGGEAASTPVTDTVKTSVISAQKSASPQSGSVVAVGDTITYTVKVDNTGGAPALGVVITDTIPANTTLTPGSISTGGTASGNVITWHVDVPANGTTSVSFKVTVNAGVANDTVIKNRAYVNSVATNETTHTVKASVITGMKSAVPEAGTAVTPGQTVTYTVTATNTGGAAGTFAITDAIPAGTTYVAGSAACGTVPSGGACALQAPGDPVGQLAWTVTLPAGTSVSVTFQVVVKSVADLAGRTEIDNVATVGTNVTNHVKHPIVKPVLGISKVDGGQAVPRGTDFTYTIAYWNSGPVDLPSGVITDMLPAGVTFKSASLAPSSNVGNVLTFGVGTVAHGTSSANPAGTITITVTANAKSSGQVCTPDGTTVTNSAIIAGTLNGFSYSNSTSVTTTVSAPNLSVTKTANPSGPVKPGESITYTITVANAGGATASGVTVKDTLPASVEVTGAGGGNAGAGTLTWTGLSITKGSPWTATVTVKVLEATASGAVLTNTVSVTPDCGADLSAQVSNTVGKASSTISTQASSGDQVGAARLPNASIHDTATVTGLAGRSAPTGKVTFDLYGPGDTACQTSLGTWAVDLAGGQASSGAQTVKVAGEYRWVASYSGDASYLASSGACGEAGESSYVAPSAPTLTTSATSGVYPDGSITDTVTITGLTAGATGTASAYLYGPGQKVSGSSCPTEVLGAPVATVDVSGVGDGGTFTHTFGTSVDGTGTYHWLVRYSGDANNEGAGHVCGIAEETSSVTQRYTPSGSLGITKTGPATSTYGGTITYTLKVNASGDFAQNDVTVTDVVPTGTTFVQGSAKCSDAGTCTPSYAPGSRTVTWKVGDLSPGASRTVTFQVTVDTPVVPAGQGLGVTVIVNTGQGHSNRTPQVDSEKVTTVIPSVLGEKLGPTPTPPTVVKGGKLPFSGAPLASAALLSMALIAGGACLVAGSRRTGRHHRR